MWLLTIVISHSLLLKFLIKWRRVLILRVFWRFRTLPELKLLLHNFHQFSRPEEVLKHRRGEFSEQDAHEYEETFADAGHLVAHEPLVELELLIGGEKADLRDDKELEDERFPYLSDQFRFIFEHALWDLAEEVGLLPKDCPILFAETYELLMLNLIILNRMVHLPFSLVLHSCPLFSILDHDEALGDSIELVLEHDDTFKIHL